MDTTKEVYALQRMLYVLDEGQYSYLASKNHQFEQAVIRLYGDVSREIARLQYR